MQMKNQYMVKPYYLQLPAAHLNKYWYNLDASDIGRASSADMLQDVPNNTLANSWASVQHGT